MTIICYRDGVMAADSEVQDCGTRRGWTQKLSRGRDGMLGGACGIDGVCVRFHDWIRCADRGAFDPKCDRGDFGAIIVLPSGEVRRMGHDGVLSPILAPFYADGCGRDLAYGAMEMGASAERAVEVAIKWDSGCGGPIQIERLDA